jgi:hypothetical protein
MGKTLQDYKLLSFSRNKWIVMGNPNNKGNDQVNNNKQQDNANPTMWEMNTIQVDCCKEVFIKTKKSKN